LSWARRSTRRLPHRVRNSAMRKFSMFLTRRLRFRRGPAPRRGKLPYRPVRTWPGCMIRRLAPDLQNTTGPSTPVETSKHPAPCSGTPVTFVARRTREAEAGVPHAARRRAPPPGDFGPLPGSLTSRSGDWVHASTRAGSSPCAPTDRGQSPMESPAARRFVSSVSSQPTPAPG